MNNYLKNKIQKLINETLEDKANEVMEKLKFNKPGSSFDYVEEGEMCESCGGEMTEGECMECGGEMRENDEMDFETPMRDNMRDNKGKFKTPMRDTVRSRKVPFKTSMRDDMYMRSRKDRYKDVDDDMNESLYPEMMEDDSESENRYNRTKDDEVVHHWMDNGRHTLKGKLDRGNKFVAHSYETDSNDDMTKKWYQNNFDKIKGTGYEYKRNDDSFFLPGFGEIITDNSYESELDEKFYGNRARLDKNKNGRLDSQDFKMLRKESVFYELTTGVNGKREKLLFTEGQFEEIIENIVLKEESKFTKGKTPAGYAEYERSIKKSKREGDDYMKDVSKKMKDYLKDGSKGKYETNPKRFPRGNGQLAKMDKMAYEIDDEGTDFNYEVAGQMIPDYDGKPPKKETIEKQIKGSSSNGNSQKYGNAEETEVNDKFAKYFEDDQLAKWKDESYKRVPSPVYNETLLKNKKGGKNKLKEEFEKMKSLISYDRKTQ